MINGFIDNIEWKFVWEQYPSAQSTLCKAINLTQQQECTNRNSNECVTAAAIAYCGPNDNYSKATGAKISFEKVVKLLTKHQNKQDRKKFRTQAWNLFFERGDTVPSTQQLEAAS